MRTLIQTLQAADEALLYAIAASWGIKHPPVQHDPLVELLNDTLLDPQAATRIWDTLADDQRQALQTLLASNSGRMAKVMFTHLYGEVRRMGRGQVEREQPYKNPSSVAEALFYKGFIAEAFDMTNTGSQSFFYIPEDLRLVLPKHRNAYDERNLPPAPPPTAALQIDASAITEQRRADSSIVDDLTALLAYTRIHRPPLEGRTLTPEASAALMPHLLTKSELRLAFMLALGVDANLIEVQDGHVFPKQAEVRHWLELGRADQIESLVLSWQKGTAVQELWSMPGLTVERADGYDPPLARRALFDALKQLTVNDDWWDVEEFIYTVKEQNPNFLRPNGDYDSWYIQDAGGEYVRGFESWDTVEAALLEYLLHYPMHWLALTDVAPEGARLTAYGRGILGFSAFPKPADPPEAIIIEPDGRLRVSRKVARVDRFQAMRFSEWQPAPPLDENAPYLYQLTAAGIAQADAQGINTGHISAFLARFSGGALPEKIERLLQTWRGGDFATATLENVLILRVTSAEALDSLLKAPETRLYFGARLGETSVIVRPDQQATLAAALQQMGIQLERPT